VISHSEKTGNQLEYGIAVEPQRWAHGKSGPGKVGTRIHEYGTDVKVQQELRHADIRTRKNIYTTAVAERLRKANRKVVRLLLSTET
jgi:integrase